MVYLKKKVKKRLTIEQVRYQACKDLSKTAKLVKGLAIQKLARSVAGSKDEDTNRDFLLEKLRVLKEVSHTSLGDRLTKSIFGEFVEHNCDLTKRIAEESLSRSKKILDCKEEWIKK